MADTIATCTLGQVRRPAPSDVPRAWKTEGLQLLVVLLGVGLWVGLLVLLDLLGLGPGWSMVDETEVSFGETAVLGIVWIVGFSVEIWLARCLLRTDR